MRRLACLLLVLSVLPVAAAAQQKAEGPPDVPVGRGTILGRVVHEGDQKPLAGVQVVLYALSDQGPGLRRSKSGPDGRFRFDGVSEDPSISWVIGARYGGVSYPGGSIQFAKGADQAHVDVTISDLTERTRGIHVSKVELRLARSGNGIRVLETYTIQNDGDHTYYVKKERRAQAPPGLRAELPASATDLQMPMGVVPEGLEHHERDLRYFGPIYPGSQDLSYSYLLPGAADAADHPRAPRPFSVEAVFPSGAGALEVLLPKGESGLVASGFKEGKGRKIDGRAYRVFDHPAVAAGGRVRIALNLAPVRHDAAAAKVPEAEIVLNVDDAAVHATETYELEVSGKEPVVTDSAHPLLHIPLPKGATDLQFGTDEAEISLIPDPRGGLSAVGTAPPGKSRIQLTYRLPVKHQPAEFDRKFDKAVSLLSVFIADTGHLDPESPRLHRRRPVPTQDLTYMHLEAFDVAAGETVPLKIGVLPPRHSLPRVAVLGSTGVVALAILAILAAPLRSTGTVAPEEETPLATREREAVYEAIRDLDFDFETGKVSAEDYPLLRDELRGRAIALLRQEREAEAARGAEQTEEEPGASRFCTACGAPRAPEHRFCGQCGARLDAEATSTEGGG